MGRLTSANAVNVGEGDGYTFGTTDLGGVSYDGFSGVCVMTRDSRRKLRSMRGVKIVFGLINAVIAMSLLRVVITMIKLNVVGARSSSLSKRRGIIRDCRYRRNYLNGNQGMAINSVSTRNDRRGRRGCTRCHKGSKNRHHWGQCNKRRM